MQHRYDHLIIGAGMTADAAAQAIHEISPSASIGIIGADDQPPYDRPPLSKGLWKDTPEDDIWRRTGQTGAALHLHRRAVAIDPKAHVVTDDQGDQYAYGKLLLATGGTARHLPFKGDRILAYRGIEDYRRLRELVHKDAQVVVVGGGFIGCEIAASLVDSACCVSMVFPEAGLGARVYPSGLSAYLSDYYRERGVDIHAGRLVKNGEQKGERVHLELDDGSSLDADVVVAGLGIVPNVELAQAAGIPVDNGIRVDEYMRTAVADIFAAGDVANFPDPALGHRRVEHEDAANSTGRIAGLAMAGRLGAYPGLPYFYSDLFDLGYEAVGRLDARLDIVEDWVEPNREGVIYYLDKQRVQGVLLWNTWDSVDKARELIRQSGPVDPSSLAGRIRG